MEVLRNVGRDIRTAAFLTRSMAGFFLDGNPTKSFWDTTDPNTFYTLIRDHLNNPNDEERQKIRDELRKFDVSSVLDCGCGPCTEYLGYQQNGRLSCVQYVGIDRSQRMLETARKRFSGVVLLKADLEQLPFVDKSFDAVVLRHVLEHQPEGYKKAVVEAVRVSRQCVIVDFFHTPLALPSLFITGRGGYANNWYNKKEFETFLDSLNISNWESLVCSGGAGQKAAIYTLII